MEVSPFYEVVQPLGRADIAVQTLAPGLGTLEGKTICELWNRDFHGDVMFPKIRELLRKKYRNINIINYDEAVTPGFCTMGQAREDAEALKLLGDTLLKKGCNGVISGIGN
jgi:hypothetical protein